MYRCKNCYHGVDSDNLNSIFQCPVCGVEREMFEKITPDDPYKGINISLKNKAIERIKEKCINCGRCKFVCENIEGIKYDCEEPICVNCGTCLLNCPTGAIVPKYSYKKVLELIKDPKKIVIISTAPAVRVALGEEFKMEYGSIVEGKMVTCLKQLGFDYVYDITFGADLTAMEEANELLNRIRNKGNLPQFSSCCPSWVKYLEIYYPQYIKNLSSCKSPIGMQGSIIKTYLSKYYQINPQDIIHVSLAPCTAKKDEITAHKSAYNKINDEEIIINDTDYIITTSELGLMIRENNIDFANLKETAFDNLLTKGSASGLKFGHSGGVTEAVLNNIKYLLNSDDEIILNEIKSDEKVREYQLKIDEYEIKIAIVMEIKNIKKVLDNFNDYKDYHFIEVMNCPKGCIGGSGQPLSLISKQNEIIDKRFDALEKCLKEDNILYSYQNPSIKKIYDEFLEYPNSDISKKILHTSYQDKSYLLKQ